MSNGSTSATTRRCRTSTTLLFPTPVGGAQQFTLLPGGGMLVADFSVIADLDASGNFVRTYGAPSGSCWLGMALDSDGTSFWASDWCASSVTRFDLATGNVIESHVVSRHRIHGQADRDSRNIFSATSCHQHSDRCGRRRVEYQQRLGQRRSYDHQSARAASRHREQCGRHRQRRQLCAYSGRRQHRIRLREQPFLRQRGVRQHHSSAHYAGVKQFPDRGASCAALLRFAQPGESASSLGAWRGSPSYGH
jgi:hypothetical protein